MSADKKDDLQLTEYNSDEEVAPEKKEEQKKQGTHVAMASAGFKEFLLKPELLRAINDCGFEHPSEVQHQAIPRAVLGIDILCQAKSGMGKTAVFVLAILQQEPDPKTTSTLVIAHTRELAFQITKEFTRFSKYLPSVKIHSFIGGLEIADDKKYLETEVPQIAVGTPGRIKQLVLDGSIDVKQLKHFVIDECDRALMEEDMRSDIQQIFLKTPHAKQVMMFSATLSPETRVLCKKFMRDPLEIYVDEGEKLTLHGLQQFYVQIPEKDKSAKLVDLLDSLEFNQCVIFTSSISKAEELHKKLVEINFPSICFYSTLKQQVRLQRYEEFKSFKARIMVTTNLMARGIDMERVNVVINYDMPTFGTAAKGSAASTSEEAADTYLHRVGRAGRFGTKGLAISFIATKEDGEVLDKVQSRFVVNIPELPEEIDASSYMN